MALHLIEPAVSADAPHQEQLDDFILVRTDEVDEGERLRPVDPVRAEGLAATLRKDGQDTPIQVCRLPGRNRWTLVVGAHRLAAARIAGFAYLRAEVVSADRESRRLREVRENIFAPDLMPIDRAAFVAELVLIKRAQAGLDAVHRDRSVPANVGRAVKAEASETLETISNVYGWSEEVGEQLGFTGRTVRNDLMIYRGLTPSVVDQLRAAKHPVLKNATQLRALAKQTWTAQKAIADRLIAGEAKSVADALTRSRGGVAAPADPEAKRLSTFLGTFSRMTLAERKGALAQLGAMLPAGLSIGEGASKPGSFSAEHARYREEALGAIDAAREVIDGIVEDDIIPGDRNRDLTRVSAELQLARFSIVTDSFELGRAA